MKATVKTLAAIVAICVATAPSPSFADTVTSDAALAAAKGWVNLRQSMDGGAFSAPESAKAYSGAEGRGTYYVVSLSGGGYVVTSGDTFLKPVLSYAASGAWEEDEAKNPLVLFVKCDVAACAAGMPEAGSAVASANAAEWAKLAAAASQKSGSRRLAATAPTADLRVAPLLTTAWNQGKVDGKLCYNYYTPGNYVCGCAATALAQVMKYFRYPTGKVTAGEWYYDSVNYNGTDVSWNMDGYYASATATTKTPWSPEFGGPYDWDAMVDAPTGSTSETARKAIGQLCRDAGLTVFAHYNVNNSGETSGFNGTQASALVKTFGYAGATASPYSENAMLASLDAGLPVLVELAGNGGHGVVADGYGYDGSGTLYVHFNFGWGESAGGSDRWYTPPSVASFTSISRMIAAIFTPAQGTRGSSVISGRVLDANGSPVSGATVTAKNALGTTATKTTNAKGIYAFILPAGTYVFTAESGSNKGERLCTVESTASPLRPDDGWGGESTVNHSQSGVNLTVTDGDTTSQAATLTHRWSFNGTTAAEYLADSIGGSSYAATANGDCVTFKDGKAELHGHGKGTGYVNLGANLLDAGAATLEMWVTKHGTVNWSRVFEYSVNNTYFIIHCWSNAKQEKCTLACYSNGKKFDTTISDFAYDCETPYHVSMTIVANGDGSSTIRIMARDTKTGALVLDRVGTASGWTLANYANPSLKLGYSTSNDKDGFAAYDEVRVYSGVVGDGQLSANAVAGPDALLATTVTDSASGFMVAAGATFVVSSPGEALVSGTANFGSDAKILVDTSSFRDSSATFAASAFNIADGKSLADIVEVTNPDWYEATASGSIVTVAPKSGFVSAAPVTATWNGGSSAPDATALTTASNWICRNIDGDEIPGALPCPITTVIIPAGSTAFTIPEGYTPNWRSVKFAPVVSTMRWARKKYSGDRSDIDVAWNDAVSWRDMPFADYDTANGTSANFSSLGWAAADWAKSQRRFDGWFYVSPAEAGAWRFSNSYDDYFAFAVDGEWVMNIITYGAAHRCTRNLKAGWHRFTIVCGDTYGGYSSSLLLKVSVNGGSERNFDALTFGSGPAQTITLADDCDWTVLGSLTLDADAVIDLAGHDLKVKDIDVDFIGAMVTNTSSTVSTVYFPSDPYQTKAYTRQVLRGLDVNIRIMQSGMRIARWTGAAGDGDVSKPGNWALTFNGDSTSDTLPTTDYTVLVEGQGVKMQVPSGTTLRCASLQIVNCSFADDCDWRGLSVTPSISGTADLNGHNFYLNTLNAVGGSSFVNTSATESQVRFPVNIVNGAVTDNGLIANMGNLSVASNVRIVMVNNGSVNAAVDSPIGYLSGGTSGFVQTGEDSSFSSGKALALGKTSGGTALFRIESGTALFGGISAQNVAGAHALIELAGGELQTGWLDFGCSSSGSATINQTSGTFTGTGNIWIGRSGGGTGVYNLTGGTFGTGVVLGQVSGTTGRMTVGGAGVANLTRGGTVGAEGVGYLTITNGGTVTATSFVVGGNHATKSGNAAGTVTLTGGELNVNNSALVVGQYKIGTLDIGGDGVVNAPSGVKLGNQTAGVGTLNLRENGVLATSKIEKGNGASTLLLNGGTLRATAAGAILGGVTNVQFNGVEFTLDSNGNNVSMANSTVTGAMGPAKLVKAGSGTLTVGTLPAVGAVKVAAGTLALTSGSTFERPLSLAHRWSFNGDYKDSVTGVAAEPTSTITFTDDGMARIPGSTAADKEKNYIELGSDKLPSDSVTMEFWATIRADVTWPKMFCLGSGTGSVIGFTFHRDRVDGLSGIDVAPNGGTFTGTGTLTKDVPYYFAFTFQANPDGSTSMKAYCVDVSTGELVDTIDQTLSGWKLTEKITQTYFRLGYSFWNDGAAQADYDEVRVWNGAMSKAGALRSAALGPNASFGEIELATGGTLDLGGQTLTWPSVACKGGAVQNGTLKVSGTINLNVGDHITNTGTIDLSDATINLVDPENLTGAGFTFISGSGTVTGKPAATNLPKGWVVSVSGGKARISKGGVAIILR